MFTEKTITIACRCNECCSEIITEISVFNLSSGKLRAECPNCGKSHLEITLSMDGKVRLSVPCVACPHPHPYTLSAESMFNKEIFILQCSFTRLDICFIGERKKVGEALQKNGEELRAMMQEADAYQDSQDDEEDIRRLEVLISFIEECAQKGNILCRCRNMKTTSAVDLEVVEDGVTLMCKNCGRTLHMSIYDEELLDAFMDIGKIAIDDDD